MGGMNRTVVDMCLHEAAYEVGAPDGGGGAGIEVVCGKCGVVKTEEMMMMGVGVGVGQQQPEAEAAETGAKADVGAAGGCGGVAAAARLIPPVLWHSTAGGGCRPNLYLELEVGGKPDHTLRGDKYVHRQTDLAAVSNIAQKLGVPNNVSMTVWQWYRRLRKELDLTKAKCLTLAFFGVCRYMGCPISEDRLSECIRMELGVRHARPYLRVIMEASSYMEGGEMVLRRCGFLNLVGEVRVAGFANQDGGRRGGSGGDKLKFALGSEIQGLAEQYESNITSRITGVAKQLLPLLTTREKNPRRAARIAVKMAQRRVCGASHLGGGRA